MGIMPRAYSRRHSGRIGACKRTALKPQLNLGVTFDDTKFTLNRLRYRGHVIVKVLLVLLLKKLRQALRETLP